MLRHRCGYALANAGHDTRAIQAWMGHKNIQHTVRYTELAPDRFKDFWRGDGFLDAGIVGIGVAVTRYSTVAVIAATIACAAVAFDFVSGPPRGFIGFNREPLSWVAYHREWAILFHEARNGRDECGKRGDCLG
jgi:hypothetical protein